jgi:ATP-binding cassette subfamily A (ABC1) protein 3
LGVTGAGKTTTFKCLTGEENPDCGDLYLGGHNVRTWLGQNKSRCLIGYCPQFDAIYVGITVREHLEIYAAIKGVRRDLLEALVQKQIREMDLLDFEHV